jgi:EAL domain-containing protein (putative c-di-GMP-specific phosphodiesterase class I)/DNA-binding NarL/FixJ family response regulator
MDRIRVMLADDEENVLDAMSGLMSLDPSLDLVGTARDAGEAIDLAEMHEPDVALVDVRMPGGGGTRAAREIRRRSPDTNVVALSASSDSRTVLSMLRAGAVGYVGKDQPADDVLRAIHRSVQGRASISVGAVADVAERLVEDRSYRTSEHVSVSAERIQRALQGDGLEIVFQPIVELSSGHVRGLEALARFHSKPRRAPQTWFTEAAGAGLLVELELAAASRAFDGLDRIPMGTYLSVNVSPETLRSPGLVELLRTIPAHRVVLELTEQWPVGDYEELAACLLPIREMGAHLAIDDVGSGFSGLGHVVRLGPDLVKLDRTLVTDVNSDPTRRALIARLVSFAQEVGIEIVAEGVETEPELDSLRLLGVPYGQGFFLGRPGPIPTEDDEWPLRWPGRRPAFR